MLLHVSSTCAHHQKVKLHYTASGIITPIGGRLISQPVHGTATYRFDDARYCKMQFWPPDDEHMCSKHVQAWSKLIVKRKFCASSWLITEININNDIFFKTFAINLLPDGSDEPKHAACCRIILNLCLTAYFVRISIQFSTTGRIGIKLLAQVTNSTDSIWLTEVTSRIYSD